MNYRPLSTEEINALRSQNCSATDWTHITVKDGFVPSNIVNTRFSGRVRLGILSSSIITDDGLSRACGIYNSSVSNCDIGDNSCIYDVRQMSDYVIEEDVAIINVGLLAVTGETTFGNGIEIEVLNEGGGRELPIYDRLSAQVAYLAVLYRHDREFTSGLLEIIRSYCATKGSSQGIVEKGSRISNSIIIRNVRICSHAHISGATLLEEGTIKSCREAPVRIGEAVIARKFIILSGSHVDGGAILEKTFVGQGVRIGRQFSAENSLFFANSEAYHGEACSLFAGPYSVSHHKSTLLIASLVSFFNAGSGTNQSNHMYKLGPVHQGILERGSKTGSFAYLLLPVHIGPYTVVMGKHYSNFDTSVFPFSYITEEKGKSELTPAMNLFTVGTRRDSEKWRSRDRRLDPEKLDIINFELFTPLIAAKIEEAIAILTQLSEKPGSQDYVYHKGIGIRRLLLKTTRKYYEIALRIFTGNELIKRLEPRENNPGVLSTDRLKVPDCGSGKWVDICGMISPAVRIEELMRSVKSLELRSLEELDRFLLSVHNNYSDYAWAWCSNLILRQNGKKPEDLPLDELIRIVSDWKTSCIKLNNMILKDAEKEFDPASRTGFGADGDTSTRDNDFMAVRGAWEKNKFVSSLIAESSEIELRADRLTSLLEGCRTL